MEAAMKRRTFFGSTLGAGALTATTGCGGQQEAAAPVDNSKLIGAIGTKKLEQLMEQYRFDLFDDFLEFYDRYVIDHELGGFMCNVAHNGTLTTEEKGTWYLGRGSWCYSFLYNNIAKEQKYLDVASKAIRMIKRHKPDGDNYWPSSLSKKGSVLNPKGGLPGDCYIAEGLAEYSKATGDPNSMKLAKDTMRKCWKHYMSPEFQDGSSPYPGAKNLWYWMLFMWFGTNMLPLEPDDELEERTAICVDAIMNHHVNPKFDLMNNIINHDLTTSNDPKYSELAGCGHATEALWMVMYEALRLKDKTLFERASESFRRHVEVSWDDVYGGVFNNCRNVDENDWQLVKIHWAEVFVLMGSLPVIEHTNAEWAKSWFDRQNTWIRENFLLAPHGYHLWKATVDRKATFDPKPGRKDIYHHPRHLMLNYLSLQRMIERGGTVSDAFV